MFPRQYIEWQDIIVNPSRQYPLYSSRYDDRDIVQIDKQALTLPLLSGKITKMQNMIWLNS